ncbi:MAG: polymorphic toxin type 23 domain-containing protein [Bacteroidota bacterium]
MKIYLLALLIWGIGMPLTFAQQSPLQLPDRAYGGIFVDQQKGNINLLLYPSLKVGSHINEFAYHLSPSLRIQLPQENELQFRLHASLRLNLSNLGIPGASLSSINMASLRYSYGETPERFADSYYFRGFRKHTLGFYYLHYASTDKTNQFAGGIEYQRMFPTGILSIKMENDAFAFLGLDEFRTASFMADYRFIYKDKLVGVGMGLTLWTGTTKGLTNLDFGQVYDMTNQYGADYSHGILHLNLHYDLLTLSVGYDSERIRMLTQDTIHQWIDDGTIPGGRLSKNRIYLQLSIAAWDYLY